MQGTDGHPPSHYTWLHTAAAEFRGSCEIVKNEMFQQRKAGGLTVRTEKCHSALLHLSRHQCSRSWCEVHRDVCEWKGGLCPLVSLAPHLFHHSAQLQQRVTGSHLSPHADLVYKRKSSSHSHSTVHTHRLERWVTFSLHCSVLLL